MMSRRALLAFLSVWLAGCASVTPIPRELGRAPTEEEQRLIETFAPRVIAVARQEGFTCEQVSFAVAEMPNDDFRATARPSMNRCAFFIRVNPRFLRSDAAVDLAGAFAHELGHVMNGDWTPGGAAVPQIERERQADAVSMRILKRMGSAECLARVEHFRRIRTANIRAWGAEQRDTITTHPSYTERMKTLETGCRS